MLGWSKGFIKKSQTKLATPFKVKSDIEKIDEIKKRLHPTNFNVTPTNHMDRVNNLKKLK